MPQRTLNTRALLWSAGIVLVVSVAVYLLNAFQVRRHAGTLLIQADRAAAAGELDQALTFYSHYLSFEPDDVDARAKYGLALQKRAATPAEKLRVLLTFEEVLQRDPTRRDIRLRLVHGYIQAHRFKEAIHNIQNLLAKADNKGELEHMLAWCLEAKGDYEGAAAAFERAIAAEPTRIESYALLAEVLEKLPERAAEADKVLDDLVRANPKSYQAYLVRGRFLAHKGLNQKSDQDLAQALKLAPEEPAVLLAAAERAEAKGQIDEARTLLQKGWAQHPQNVGLIRALAAVEMRVGGRENAIKILRSALKDVPRSWEIQVLLTDLLIDDHQLTEAAARIDELRKAGTPQALADYLEARLEIQRGQWSQALQLLERARPNLEKLSEWAGRLHALLGWCYGHAGNLEMQVSSFRRAVELEPNWTMARYGLGQALFALGRLDDAWLQFQQIRAAADAPEELWPALARVQMYQQLRLPAAQRDWTRVEEALARATEKSPDLVDIPLLRAEMLAAQERYAEAATCLEKACAQRPEQILLWAARADLAARQKDLAQAHALLDRAEKQLGVRTELLSARLRVLLQEGGSAARQGLLQVASSAERLPALQRVRVWRELASAWATLGDRDRAQALWQQLANEQPKDLTSRFALFELALQARDLPRARNLLAELRQLEGEQGHLWRFAAAQLQVEEAGLNPQKLAAAARSLEQLARRLPDWPRVPLLQARVAELQGRLDQAVTFYTQALDLGDRQPRHVARLVRLLVQFKDYVNADLALRKMEVAGPLPPELARLGVEAALAAFEPKRVLQLLPLAAPATSRDYRDRLWLGSVHHRLGEDAQAREVLEQAARDAPHTPDTWVALVRQLAWIGQRDEALKVAEQAGSKVAPKLRWYTLARCYAAMGRFQDAEQAFAQALKAAADDFVLLAAAADYFITVDQPDKAAPLLGELLKTSSAAPAEFVARARRQLAILLSAAPNKRSAALALLATNLKSAPDNVHDLRVRAYVHAGASSAERARALAFFEESSRHVPLTDDEQFLFARLLADAGDPARACGQLASLLAVQPDQPQYLAFHVEQLVKAEDVSQAKLYLQRLEKIEPDSPRVARLKTLVG